MMSFKYWLDEGENDVDVFWLELQTWFFKLDDGFFKHCRHIDEYDKDALGRWIFCEAAIFYFVLFTMWDFQVICLSLEVFLYHVRSMFIWTLDEC